MTLVACVSLSNIPGFAFNVASETEVPMMFPTAKRQLVCFSLFMTLSVSRSGNQQHISAWVSMVHDLLSARCSRPTHATWRRLYRLAIISTLFNWGEHLQALTLNKMQMEGHATTTPTPTATDACMTQSGSEFIVHSDSTAGSTGLCCGVRRSRMLPLWKSHKELQTPTRMNQAAQLRICKTERLIAPTYAS